MISCLYYNLEATGYRVFAIRERADQRSGQGSCCSGWYWLSLRRKSGWPCATEISIIVSVLLSLPHHTLEKHQLWKSTRTGDPYEISFLLTSKVH